MISIDREMKAKETITGNSNYYYCQASLNSDGNITLRNYDLQNKDSDEIIILSAKVLNSLALVKVIVICSCSNKELVKLENKALLWLFGILNFLCPSPCLMM